MRRLASQGILAAGVALLAASAMPASVPVGAARTVSLSSPPIQRPARPPHNSQAQWRVRNCHVANAYGSDDGLYAHIVRAGDLDGDDKEDVLTWQFDLSASDDYRTVAYRGTDGTRLWQSPSRRTSCLMVGDVTGDDQNEVLDLQYAGGAVAGVITLTLRDGKTGLARWQRAIPTSRPPAEPTQMIGVYNAAIMSDATGDGIDDIVVQVAEGIDDGPGPLARTTSLLILDPTTGLDAIKTSFSAADGLMIVYPWQDLTGDTVADFIVLRVGEPDEMFAITVHGERIWGPQAADASYEEIDHYDLDGDGIYDPVLTEARRQGDDIIDETITHIDGWTGHIAWTRHARRDVGGSPHSHRDGWVDALDGQDGDDLIVVETIDDNTYTTTAIDGATGHPLWGPVTTSDPDAVYIEPSAEFSAGPLLFPDLNGDTIADPAYISYPVNYIEEWFIHGLDGTTGTPLDPIPWPTHHGPLPTGADFDNDMRNEHAILYYGTHPIGGGNSPILLSLHAGRAGLPALWTTTLEDGSNSYREQPEGIFGADFIDTPEPELLVTYRDRSTRGIGLDQTWMILLNKHGSIIWYIDIRDH